MIISGVSVIVVLSQGSVFLSLECVTGSVFGHVLVLIRVAEVFDVIALCGGIGLLLYELGPTRRCTLATPAASTRTVLRFCVDTLTNNRLRMNADKTEITWIGTDQQPVKLDISYRLSVTSPPLHQISASLSTDMATHVASASSSFFF